MAIITMPSVPAFRSSEFGLDFNSDLYLNQQTRQMQVVERQGARWRSKYTLPAMKRDQLAAWQAFLASLRGQSNTFMGYDPDGVAPRGSNVQVAGATNIITQSDSNAVWSSNNGGIKVADAEIAPNGTFTADTVEGTGASSSGIFRGVTGITDNTDYCYSGFFKAIDLPSDTKDWRIGFESAEFGTGTQSARVRYNIQTGAFVQADAGVISHGSINYGDGYYRIWVSARSATAAPSTIISFYSGLAGVRKAAIWGHQLNVGLIPLPYIPTGAVAATRPDGLSVYGANQTGSTLKVRGFEALQVNALRRGDYIGVGGRMYILTANASTDLEGAATLQISPMLVASPADGASVITAGVTCEMRLTDEGQATWQTNENGVCSGLSFSAVEVK